MHPSFLRTIRDVLGIVAASLAITGVVAFVTSPPSTVPARAQEQGGPVTFPIWTFDCTPLEKYDLTFDVYTLTMKSDWVVPSQNPSAGYLRVAAIGERDTTAVLRILTAKDQLDWKTAIEAQGIDPASEQAVKLASASGSFSVKQVDASGKVEFRFGWAMFPEAGEQLSIEVRGCKSTSNRDASESFYQTTMPNAAVTISNIDQRVVSVCTTCATTNMLDCEHVTQTAVVLDTANAEIVFDDDTEAPLDPIDTGGAPLLQGPTGQGSQLDWLATVEDPTKNIFDETNLKKYTRHPSRAALNGGTPDGMGSMPYFLGSGLKQYLDTDPDSTFQFAGALYTSNFAKFFSVPEHQTIQVRSGARGYVMQPAAYLDFSADVRLGCISYGFCGQREGDTVALSVDAPGAMSEPLQLLLFVPITEGDTNGDGIENALDELPAVCTETPAKCKYTLTGKMTGIQPESVMLYAGGSNPKYETKETQLNADGNYTFTDVLPGMWVVKVDKNTFGQPCHVVQLVKVGTDGTAWKITDELSVFVDDIDGSDQCHGSATPAT